MTDHSTADRRIYLLLDDHGGRSRMFKYQVGTENLLIQTVFEANELADLRNDLEVLDGAIIDFHLNTSTGSDYEYLRYPCTEPDCPDIAADGGSADHLERARREHDWHITAGIPEVNVTTGLA